MYTYNSSFFLYVNYVYFSSCHWVEWLTAFSSLQHRSVWGLSLCAEVHANGHWDMTHPMARKRWWFQWYQWNIWWYTYPTYPKILTVGSVLRVIVILKIGFYHNWIRLPAVHRLSSRGPWPKARKTSELLAHRLLCAAAQTEVVIFGSWGRTRRVNTGRTRSPLGLMITFCKPVNGASSTFVA